MEDKATQTYTEQYKTFINSIRCCLSEVFERITQHGQLFEIVSYSFVILSIFACIVMLNIVRSSRRKSYNILNLITYMPSLKAFVFLLLFQNNLSLISSKPIFESFPLTIDHILILDLWLMIAAFTVVNHKKIGNFLKSSSAKNISESTRRTIQRIVIGVIPMTFFVLLAFAVVIFEDHLWLVSIGFSIIFRISMAITMEAIEFLFVKPKNDLSKPKNQPKFDKVLYISFW